MVGRHWLVLSRYGDNHWHFSGQPTNKQFSQLFIDFSVIPAALCPSMKAIVYRHQQAGFGRIYWRCFGTHLDNSLAVPEAAPRWTADDEAKWCAAQDCKSGWLPYINMTKQFDPLKVASDYGREIGVAPPVVGPISRGLHVRGLFRIDHRLSRLHVAK